ncbi:MAG: hypothetical protein ABIL09_16075 [Gemmatimonadota bacterium]
MTRKPREGYAEASFAPGGHALVTVVYGPGCRHWFAEDAPAECFEPEPAPWVPAVGERVRVKSAPLPFMPSGSDHGREGQIGTVAEFLSPHAMPVICDVDFDDGRHLVYVANLEPAPRVPKVGGKGEAMTRKLAKGYGRARLNPACISSGAPHPAIIWRNDGAWWPANMAPKDECFEPEPAPWTPKPGDRVILARTALNRGAVGIVESQPIGQAVWVRLADGQVRVISIGFLEPAPAAPKFVDWRLVKHRATGEVFQVRNPVFRAAGWAWENERGVWFYEAVLEPAPADGPRWPGPDGGVFLMRGRWDEDALDFWWYNKTVAGYGTEGLHGYRNLDGHPDEGYDRAYALAVERGLAKPAAPEQPAPKFADWRLVRTSGQRRVWQIAESRWNEERGRRECRRDGNGHWNVQDFEANLLPAEPREWERDASRALPGEKVRVVEHPVRYDGTLSEATEDADLAGQLFTVIGADTDGEHPYYEAEDGSEIWVWNCRRVVE